MGTEDNLQNLIDLLDQGLKEYRKGSVIVPLDKTLPHSFHQVKTSWVNTYPPSHNKVASLLLYDLLKQLTNHNEQIGKILKYFYVDEKKDHQITKLLNISLSTFYRLRKKGGAMLAEIALENENKAYLAYLAKFENRLETTNNRLFGLEMLQEQLGQLLHPESEIKMFCLAGMGGIGKTTLADVLVRQAIKKGYFSEIVWLTAKQEQLTAWGEVEKTNHSAFSSDELLVAIDQQLNGLATPSHSSTEILATLKTTLSKTPHLIVIDNLESSDDYKEILSVLRQLSQLATILLTSRVSMHQEGDIHVTHLDELNLTNTEALIRYEATLRGLQALAETPTDTVAQIYELTGGNPLALKLVVGQVQVRSLSTVLLALKEASGYQAETLFEFIYRQAWDLLDDNACKVLLAMSLATFPGITLTHLTKVTKIDYADLNKSLDLLIKLSLVNVGGSYTERRYYIHRLTETFLHKQVTKWLK